MLQKFIEFSFCLALCACSQNNLPDQVQVHDKQGGIYAAEFSDDADYLLISTVNQSAALWDFSKNTPLYHWSHTQDKASNLSQLALSRDGKVAVTTDQKKLAIWDAQTGKSRGFWELPEKILKIKLSESGQYALIAYHNHSIQMLDLRDGRSVWQVQHAASIQSMDLSPDTKMALVGCDDGTATLWDIQNSKRLYLWKDKGSIRHVALSPNHKLALTSTPSQAIKIWDTKNGELKYELRASNNLISWFQRDLINVSSAVFADDESFLVTGSPPGQIHVWEMNQGTLIAEWSIPKDHSWKRSGLIVYATAINEKTGTVHAEASNGKGYSWKLP